jgi:hypothetical protein
MPAEFYIDATRQMVFSRGHGIVTSGDIEGHMRRLKMHPEFQPAFNQLLDFREASEIDVPNQDLRELATRSIFDRTSKRAFLVNSDLQFGLARMYGTLRDVHGQEVVRVFRDQAAALAWLGLAAGADPARYPPAPIEPAPPEPPR